MVVGSNHHSTRHPLAMVEVEVVEAALLAMVGAAGEAVQAAKGRQVAWVVPQVPVTSLTKGSATGNILLAAREVVVMAALMKMVIGHEVRRGWHGPTLKGKVAVGVL